MLTASVNSCRSFLLIGWPNRSGLLIVLVPHMHDSLKAASPLVHPQWVLYLQLTLTHKERKVYLHLSKHLAYLGIIV